MAYDFRLQDPGEGIHEAEIIEILVSRGDNVKEGDNLLVVETDKAAVDIPSPVSGEVVEIAVSEGEVVEVGDVLFVLEEADESTDAGDSGDDSAGAAEKETGREVKKQEGQARQARSHDDRDPGDETAASKADEREADNQDVPGDGERKDRGVQEERRDDVLATPAVRGLARKHDIDLSALSGSGKDGRILESDVREAADADTKGNAGEPVSEVRRSDGKPVETRRVKLRSIRRATARRMSRAWREIPHAIHYDSIDITDIEKVRHDQKEAVAARGGKLTLTSVLVKAIAAALKVHPRFNAVLDTDADEIVLASDANIGVAVASARGLIVPVVKHVDQKSVADIAIEITYLSEKVREERPGADLLRDGTFTLTNIGSLGGTQLSPIINPPQVAIFGAARAQLQQPIHHGLGASSEAARLVLPVCLAFDHRVNDGADAAQMMGTVKSFMEDPDRMLFQVA